MLALGGFQVGDRVLLRTWPKHKGYTGTIVRLEPFGRHNHAIVSCDAGTCAEVSIDLSAILDELELL